MRFESQPVNLEAERGPEAALRLQVRLADLPPGYSNVQVWAARLPGALAPDTLTALATGALSLAAVTGRTQASAWDGLRALNDVGTSVEAGLGGSVLAVEGQLFEEALDMALAWDQASSMDTVFDPSLERSDQCWFLAATALDSGGAAVLAWGGLGQWEGQEHLAAVWLSPSSFAPLVQIGDWLVNTVRSFKPVLDWRIAQTRPAGSDWCLSDVRLTDEELTDAKIAIYVTPKRATEGADGIAAPDRRQMSPSFTLRVLCVGDDPQARSRTLATIADSLRALLNTRKLRSATLPCGDSIDLAFVTDMSFGKTDTFIEGSDLSWNCRLVRVGMF